MATSSWKDDADLENDLKKYVAQNLKRSEVLDFVQKDFAEYPWSMRRLDRRLQHFSIKYINYDTNIETVRDAVVKKIQGPGQLLGYRGLNNVLRTKHGIKLLRDLTYTVMQDVDPDGLERRSLRNRKKKEKADI